MKTKITLYIILFLFSINAQSQKSPRKVNARAEAEYEGNIKLNDGTEWNGKFKYSAVTFEGMLLIENNGKIQSLSPSVVKSFSFFDNDLGITRMFYSLKVNSKSVINQSFNFFELIYEGKKISILGRNTAKKKTNLAAYTVSNGMVRKKKVYTGFEKYILDQEEDKLYPFTRNLFLNLIKDDIQTLNYMYKKHYKLHEKDIDQYFELIDLHDKSAQSAE